MKALVGDRIEVPGTHVGEGRRQGEVVEVRGADGGPPYLVRWSDGHEGLFFPGLDAVHRPHGRPAAKTGRVTRRPAGARRGRWTRGPTAIVGA